MGCTLTGIDLTNAAETNDNISGQGCTLSDTDLSSAAKTAVNIHAKYGTIMVNESMQFPLDVAKEIFSEHSYFPPNLKKNHYLQ